MLMDVAAIDDARLVEVGGVSLTVGGLVTGAVIIAGAWLLSRLVTHFLCRLRDRSQRTAAALYVLEKLAGYGIVIETLDADDASVKAAATEARDALWGFLDGA